MKKIWLVANLLLLWFALLPPQAFADRIEPQNFVSKTAEGKLFRGIILTCDAAQLDLSELGDFQGVYIDPSLDVFSSSKEIEDKLQTLFFDQTIDRDHLLAVKNTILQHCNSQMVSVEIPEQDITSAVVVFEVKKTEIGHVTYKGNRWFSKEKTEKALGLHTGDVIDESILSNNISWLNENPFHYSEAILSPGKGKFETDVEIITKDRFPLRFYAGADNTGVKSTGEGRYFGGLTLSNFLSANGLLTYQFTANNHYDRFYSHVMNYTAFLPWQHLLMLYGGYSRIEPQISGFRSHGKEAQASCRYKIPFKPLYTLFQHQFSFGFDYKYVTSNLFFVGELDPMNLVSSHIVNISQGMLGYQLEWADSSHQLTARFDCFGSLVKWLPHQSDLAYSSLRQGAKPRYFYALFALGDMYTFPTKDAFSALMRIQAASTPLIPSEQFKLGGYNSVRGYEENVFISDNGICLNLELRTRPLIFFKKIKDELTLLAFMDYGWGYNYKPFDGIKKAAVLWSVGPGLRYTINPYAILRIDYGFKLHAINFDSGFGMWHVGATVGY